MAGEPKPTLAAVVEADVQGVRSAMVDARIATRWVERLRWARVITAVVVQVAIAFIGWRFWKWRARRRRQ